MGTSVILSAGDNKKEAPGAEVAVTDTELGAQSLLMTQCHGLYFSQQIMERLIRVSHHRCVQADEQNHTSNLSHSLLGWRENFLNYPTIVSFPALAVGTGALVCAPSPASQIEDQLSGLWAEGT